MALKIEAMKRLSTPVTAARADEDMAIDLLTTLGFKGLKSKANREDSIRYSFTGWNEKKMRQALGNPKESSNENPRFKYGTQGVISVFPETKMVTLRNSKKVQEDGDDIEE